MKISNNPVVSTANEPNGGEAPSVQFGPLDPCQNYSDSKLYDLKPGSIYIQQIYTEQNCVRKYVGSCMWFKVRHSGGDLCSGSRGKSNDWAKMATGSFMCGSDLPSGAPEFCCMPLMSYYARVVETPSAGCGCRTAFCGCGNTGQTIYLYLKVNENCAAEDWILVSPNLDAPNVMGMIPYSDTCDASTNDYLNQLPVGSRVLVIGEGGCVAADYLKVGCDCNSIKDWVDVKAPCVIKGSDNPNDLMPDTGTCVETGTANPNTKTRMAA